MDDIQEILTTEDGRKYRLYVYESGYVPRGFVAWCVDKYEPEVGTWRTLKQSQKGYTLDDAFVAGRSWMEAQANKEAQL